MTTYSLDQFINDAEAISTSMPEPADCVLELAPLMHRLLAGGHSFLKPEHFKSDPKHYARNAIHIAKTDGLSLYTLVWNPGQWTPVHDHGTWGVVGIVRGVLEERNFIRMNPANKGDKAIQLVRSGPILLSEKTVTTFVPNPDHIHKTGVPTEREQAVSLHLYGRTMNNYHTYDLEHGTRNKILVSHNTS